MRVRTTVDSPGHNTVGLAADGVQDVMGSGRYATESHSSAANDRARIPDVLDNRFAGSFTSTRTTLQKAFAAPNLNDGATNTREIIAAESAPVVIHWNRILRGKPIEERQSIQAEVWSCLFILLS